MRSVLLLILGFLLTTPYAKGINYVDQAYLSAFGRNYIKNGGAEQGRSGWATYGNAAATSPATGTGGSPTHITLTASSSGPISEQYSFLMSNSGSTSAQGEGVSYAFTVDAGHQASALQIAFDYTVASGTFVAGSQGGTITASDVTVWVYDVTNGAPAIQPAPYVLTGSTGNYFHYQGTFQTASNSTSYRLIFHVGSTNTSAWGLKFDNVSVQPIYHPYGAPITDWQSFTPTGSWITNTTYTGFWRRIGGDMQVRVKLALAGAPTAAVLSVNLPTGFSIDTTRLAGTTSAVSEVGFGDGQCAAVDATFYVVYNNTTSVKVRYDSASSSSAVDATHPGIFANTDEVDINFMVPIAGWGSSVLMSQDTDARPVVGRMHNATATVTGSYSDVTWTTLDSDSHGAFNATSSATTYTISVPGYYDFSGQLNVSATTIAAGNNFCVSLENFTTTTTLLENCYVYEGTNNTSLGLPFNFRGINLNSGTAIKIQVKSSTTSPVLTSSNTLNFWTIERVSGPSTIASSDAVTARYHASATAISGSLATVSWTTNDYDQWGQMNSGTYTISVSGKYAVISCVAFSAASSAAGNAVDLQLQKNGSVVGEVAPVYQSTQVLLPVCISDIINCNGGDTIRVQVSSAANTPAILSSNSKNFFAIVREGN